MGGIVPPPLGFGIEIVCLSETNRRLLVKCYENKMVKVTLQLCYPSNDSASGG